MKKLLSAFLLISLLAAPLSLSGCGALKKFSATDMTLFDTETVITGWDTDKESFDKKAEAITEELARLHRLYDIYDSYDSINNLKTVNDNAGESAVKVDGDIISLLEFCRIAYETTNGAVNIAMGSVLRLWHDCRIAAQNDPANAALPDENALRAAAEHTDISSLEIDAADGTVYISDPLASIDVGAVAKGYATELCAQFIEEKGWEHIALSVGGNVRTVGLKADGSMWITGIENPGIEAGSSVAADGISFDGAYFCRLSMGGKEALVTSGSYQRYFEVDGVRYHHIIDPETLRPENRYVSVSILCDNSGLADVLSTALFNMSEADGREILSRFLADAVWVYPDGRVAYTDGISKRLQKD